MSFRSSSRALTLLACCIRLSASAAEPPKEPVVGAELRGDANRLTVLGRDKEAADVLAKLVSLCREKLAPEHPETLRAEVELAAAHRRAGAAGQAEAALRRVLETMTRVLGPE